jgi:hypothetical protein
MSKFRIRFFCSFCDSENCKSVYERLCEVDKMDNYGPDKDIYIVTDDTFTHAIIINTAIPPLTIPKENIIGIAFEPTPFLQPYFSQGFLNTVKEHVSKYFIGDATQLPHPFTNQYAFMWHITPPRREPIKNRTMSIMVSQKNEAPGHIYRHELVRSILSSDLDIDIYGRGCGYYPPDRRLKGDFNDDEPYENYDFHICIENFSIPNYTSEKYTNTVLWGTTPIYWGATETLFPNITINLSGKISEDMRLLAELISNPIKYKKYFSRDDIRDKLNILKNLDKLF